MPLTTSPSRLVPRPSRRGLVLARHDALAVLGVALFAALGLGLSTICGLTLEPGLRQILAVPQVLLMLTLLLRLYLPAESRVTQLFTYMTLWSLLPTAGAHLSYVAALAGMPLQTETFRALDRALGFDWGVWARFVSARPVLHWLTHHAYLSYGLQPFAALTLLALFGKRAANARLIVATIIALLVTITVSGLVPAYGVGIVHGVRMPADDVLAALWSGQHSGLPYAGIISFPSFHAAMAVLFTAAYAGMPRCLVPAATLNLFMLLSVPFTGDHFLVDVIGGVIVASGAIWLAWRIVPEPNPCA